MKTSTNTLQKMAQPNPNETVAQYIERRVKEKFAAHLNEPIRGKAAPAAPAAPAPKPRPNDNQKLALRLEVARSKKRLVEHFKKQREQAAEPAPAQKSANARPHNSNKSLKERIKENFKGFQFTLENNKKIQR